MVSIPSFHVSTKAQAKGGAKVKISSRQDAVHSGVFELKIGVSFDPATDSYPTGSFTLKADLSDALKATFSSASIDLINSFGKHNPTVYLTGRCKVRLGEDTRAPEGCRYWLMIANNKRDSQGGTPDIIGFAIHDRNGNRVAYGTGPVVSGDIEVSASGA